MNIIMTDNTAHYVLTRMAKEVQHGRGKQNHGRITPDGDIST